jgi:preprotein translocase subunit SecA
MMQIQKKFKQCHHRVIIESIFYAPMLLGTNATNQVAKLSSCSANENEQEQVLDAINELVDANEQV